MFLKHFSCSLRNIYGLICFSFDIFSFFPLPLSFGKESVLKTLLQHIFAISDAVFDPLQHKLYLPTLNLMIKKKSKKTSVCPPKLSGNFLKLIEISKKYKNCVISLEFQCSKRGQITPKLINLASLRVDFYKFGSNNQNLCV